MGIRVPLAGPWSSWTLAVSISLYLLYVSPNVYRYGLTYSTLGTVTVLVSVLGLFSKQHPCRNRNHQEQRDQSIWI